MKTKIALISALAIGLFGCSDAPKQEGLNFFNDMESINGWGNVWGLTKENKHSGELALKTDSIAIYSYGFKAKLKDISKNKVKKVRYTVYCMSTNPNVKGTVVFAIDAPDKPNIFWDGNAVEKHVKEANKWEKVTGEIDLTKFNNPENTINLYVWNNGKEVIYADDFELKFIE